MLHTETAAATHLHHEASVLGAQGDGREGDVQFAPSSLPDDGRNPLAAASLLAECCVMLTLISSARALQTLSKLMLTLLGESAQNIQDRPRQQKRFCPSSSLSKRWTSMMIDFYVHLTLNNSGARSYPPPRPVQLKIHA